VAADSAVDVAAREGLDVEAFGSREADAGDEPVGEGGMAAWSCWILVVPCRIRRCRRTVAEGPAADIQSTTDEVNQPGDLSDEIPEQ
jgi:hypothetical protein